MAAAAAAFNLEEQDKIEGSEIADLFERCESLIAPQHRIVTTHLDAGGAQPFLERTVEIGFEQADDEGEPCDLSAEPLHRELKLWRQFLLGFWVSERSETWQSGNAIQRLRLQRNADLQC